MFRSATFKLTMWYLAIVMAISLLFSIVIYQVATAELSRSLRQESARISDRFPIFQDSPYLNKQLDYGDASHRLLLHLIALNILVLISAGLASYLLAKRTLSPIELAHDQQKRFTANVSHELRTPLTAIRMESEVALLSSTNSDELKATLISNLEEVSKLEGLINSLLRLSQLEEAELRYGFTRLSTHMLATKAVAQVQTIADSRGITVSSSIKDASVFGDSGSLVQMLVIVLDNAIKYSVENSLVSILGKPTGGNYTFIIQDTGVGIDVDALEHIFERFYRADSSRTKHSTSGYGLGLSIAHMIADIHQADITLTSQVGAGTTVTVTIPIGRSNEPS